MNIETILVTINGAVALPIGFEDPEWWVNKMTVKTTKMWEQNHPDILDDSEELWLDEQLRKQYL